MTVPADPTRRGGVRPKFYGPTPLRVVHWGPEVILGGGCGQFGCGHTFAEHDMGDPGRAAELGRDHVPASGGKCRGIRDPFGDGKMARPCECERFLDTP